MMLRTTDQLTDAFHQCFDIFRRRIHPADGASTMCQLHDFLGADCQTSHNCLGCNFNQVTWSIHRYLSRYQLLDDVSESCTFYILRLYVLVERIYIIFDIIQLPEEIRAQHFSVFREIHKWANFIKHPGPFFLVHHPSYFISGDLHLNPKQFGVIIDQEFVNKHYSRPGKNKKLWDLLMNNTSVAVVFPCPMELTNRTCDAVAKFLEVIRTNTVYQEILSKRSTYEQYFSEPDEEA